MIWIGGCLRLTLPRPAISDDATSDPGVGAGFEIATGYRLPDVRLCSCGVSRGPGRDLPRPTTQLQERNGRSGSRRYVALRIAASDGVSCATYLPTGSTPADKGNTSNPATTDPGVGLTGVKQLTYPSRPL